jgi:feruloyl esterase
MPLLLPQLPAPILIAISGLLSFTAHAADEASHCKALVGREIAGATIVSAEPIVPAPEWITPNIFATHVSVHHSFCRAFARIDETIGYELWLPPGSKWNGRLLGAGVGGSAGTYNYAGLGRGVERGFAVASTDSGHLLTDKAWMLDKKAAADYAHRAVHLMTVSAKAIVTDFYGRKFTRSYFMGCSGGGREALKELQQYPADYDGILAGAPGPNMPLLSVRHMLSGLWQQQSGLQLTDADWKLVQDLAVKQCDRLDGLADGVIEDPRVCRTDLHDLACSPGNSSQCLDAAKLQLIQRIVAPIPDNSGKLMDTGLYPGVRSRPGPPPSLVVELFGQGVHHDLAWNPATFDPAADLAAAYREQPDLRADNADLRAFKARHGKAIIYQGWMDPSVIAQQTVGYYENVQVAAGGAAEAASFVRLFMVPGMLHCGGGDSTDRFGGEAGSVATDADHDALSALMAWVETGKAPDRLIASRVVGKEVVRARPLCAYPKAAHYRGSGDANNAANFECRAARAAPMSTPAP